MKRMTKNGLKLAYEETGSGTPSLLFAHACSCDHTTFALQVEHFRKAHRIVNLDLRGHGESDAPPSGYAPADFADDLAFVSRELGLHKPVVVGHSLGSIAALALAARHPEVASAIVMLGSAVFVPAQAAEQLAPVFRAAMEPGGMPAWLRFVEGTFAPTDDVNRKMRLLATVERTPHAVVAQTLAGMLSFDAAAAAAAARVPVLCVRSVVPVDTAAFRRACPSLAIDETRGVGHFAMLDAADEVSAMIGRFLARL
jgi:pimeloyl-ACP methyl ester carboxylesterase